MKWVVRKGGIPTNDAKEKLSFEEIDLQIQDGDPDLPEVLFKLGYVEWVTYPGPANNFRPLKIDGATRRKYEIFCGGFLYYHDEEFKKYSKGKGYTDEKGYPEWKEYPDNKFEHKIFFEWFKMQGKNIPKVVPKGPLKFSPKLVAKDVVRIYINQTPAEFNSNPPPPPEPPPPES